jgi:hypothetical protein
VKILQAPHLLSLPVAVTLIRYTRDADKMRVGIMCNGRCGTHKGIQATAEEADVYRPGKLIREQWLLGFRNTKETRRPLAEPQAPIVFSQKLQGRR